MLGLMLIALVGLLALQAAPAAGQELVFSQDGNSVVPSIQRTDGSATALVQESATVNVRDVAVNPLDGKLYWTDSGDASGFSTFDSVIRRSDPDGSNVESFFQSEVEDPRGIVLDAENGKMYWADAFAPEVARANLDGTGFEVLVSTVSRPVDIALDPVNNKIYWADDGTSSARIQRANLDGTNVEDVATGFNDVLTVAVDPSGGKVYWVGDDGSGDSMRRADLDGANPETIIASVSRFTRNLEVEPANAKLYWTVATASGSIQVSNLNGSNQQEFLDTGSNSQPRGLALVAPRAISVQPVSGAGLVTFGSTGVSISFGSGSGSGTATVTQYGTPPSSTDGLPSGATVSSYRFVITTDGFSIGSGTQVRFDTDILGGINAPSDVDIYTRTTSVTGSFTPLTTTVDGTDLVADVTGFSEFVLTSTNASNPLPVELTAFTAVADGDTAVLTWDTASESNNAGFYVEHRQRSGAFASLGFVEGAGTTDTAQRYRFDTRSLGYGEHAFRLRQVDLDGTASLSEVRTVQITPEALDISAFPNPFYAGQPARITVTPRTAQQVTVDVYDVLGRRVERLHNGRLDAGQPATFMLSGDRHASGLYFVRVSGEQFSTTKRLTLVR